MTTPDPGDALREAVLMVLAVRDEDDDELDALARNLADPVATVKYLAALASSCRVELLIPVALGRARLLCRP